MMLLMALVIAMFVIVGAYVGYHASQSVEEKGESHNINVDLEMNYQSSGLVQILQNPELKKSVL